MTCLSLSMVHRPVEAVVTIPDAFDQSAPASSARPTASITKSASKGLWLECICGPNEGTANSANRP